MHPFSARRLVSACAVSAVVAAGLIAPGAASAASSNPACAKGVDITAAGSSLQYVLQDSGAKAWTKEFNGSTTKSKFACPSSPAKPTVTYVKSGSGAALKSWGAESTLGTPEEKLNSKGVKEQEIGFGVQNGFVGTDEPPNATQLSHIALNEATVEPESVLSIPVAQESVAIIVNLPTGCTAESTVTNATGRLALSDESLSKVFDGEYTKWSQLSQGGVNKLSSPACEAEPIKVIVRHDQSGTTHIVKRFLGQLNNSSFPVTGEPEKTWGQLSEGALNTVWPTATHAINATASSGSGLAAEVKATPGSIGYLNLAEARSLGFGGSGGQTFWVMLQNTEKKGKLTYTDPSTGSTEAVMTGTTPQNANCDGTVYTDNENKPFPPASVGVAWDTATTLASQKKSYALCGLTYDLALEEYSNLSGKEATQEEEETVKTYLQFSVDKKGGQADLEGQDYYPLPKGAVATEAVQGAASITWKKA